MTISLLIPVKDYDIIALVHSMKGAMDKVPELVEILVGDDGSSPEFREKYRSMEGNGVRIIVSEKNIGRASMRNRLAIEARGEYLLFIDADTMLPSTAEAYLKKWIMAAGNARVMSGGILYRDSPPGDPDKLLRWKYGRMKEQKKAADRNKRPNAGFSTFNVLFERSVFSKIRFDEELRQYGHEDTLMGYQLEKAGIKIMHIDNGLYHEGLETNKDYLAKTKLGIENLSHIYDRVTDKRTFSETVRILGLYNKLEVLRLTRVLAGIFIKYRDRMEIRLDSNKISLNLFSFYKICMFCTYREIHRRKPVLPFF
ncbi:MAG TPA: glycosyltransferase [Bacteroidales bacterium]|nr:glycosyltransferase [Bacteroidales bacterium]